MRQRGPSAAVHGSSSDGPAEEPQDRGRERRVHREEVVRRRGDPRSRSAPPRARAARAPGSAARAPLDLGAEGVPRRPGAPALKSSGASVRARASSDVRAPRLAAALGEQAELVERPGIVGCERERALEGALRRRRTGRARTARRRARTTASASSGRAPPRRGRGAARARWLRPRSFSAMPATSSSRADERAILAERRGAGAAERVLEPGLERVRARGRGAARGARRRRGARAGSSGSTASARANARRASSTRPERGERARRAPRARRRARREPQRLVRAGERPLAARRARAPRGLLGEHAGRGVRLAGRQGACACFSAACDGAEEASFGRAAGLAHCSRARREGAGRSPPVRRASRRGCRP